MHSHRRVQRAVSPVIGAVILIAITVGVGAALWGYANSATGVALQGQAEQAASNINQLNEKFIIFNFNATTSSLTDDTITIWYYNNGNLPTNITSVTIRPGETAVPLPCVVASTTPLPLQLPKGQVVTLNLHSCNLEAGTTYFIQSVALFGNSYTYFQKA